MNLQMGMKLLSIVFQVALFAAIPFMWWAVTARKKKVGFFQWIGLYKPGLKTKWYFFLLFTVFYILWYGLRSVITMKIDSRGLWLTSPKVEANAYLGLGFSAIPISFIQAFIQNGLAEELFFRGFLLKRFSNRFGKISGWLVSSVLFGLIHIVLGWAAGIPFDVPTQIMTFASVSCGGLLLAFLNEKIFNGSIFPSIVFHGCGDFVSAMIQAFSR